MPRRIRLRRNALEGTGSYAGETYRIQFKNENLIACRNDKTDVTVPDLICMVDKNGNPMTNPDFSPGDEMNVFAFTCSGNLDR